MARPLSALFPATEAPPEGDLDQWIEGQTRQRAAAAAGTPPPPFEVDVSRLPAGSRPVLVFINTKSGPQVGAGLRRRLLRLLNPVQVRPHALPAGHL